MTDINGLIAQQVAEEVAKRLDASALADTIVKSVDAVKIAKGITESLTKSVKANKFEVHMDDVIYLDGGVFSDTIEKHVLNILKKSLGEAK